MPFTEIKIMDKTNKDSIHLHITNGQIERITCIANTISFLDKDTNMYVSLVPALDISGYGDNIDEAMELVNFSVDEFFNHLTKMPIENISIELSKLGWKKNVFKNKEFSRAFVDIEGELQGFNIDHSTIQRKTLEIA